MFGTPAALARQRVNGAMTTRLGKSSSPIRSGLNSDETESARDNGHSEAKESAGRLTNSGRMELPTRNFRRLQTTLLRKSFISRFWRGERARPSGTGLFQFSRQP